jgi:hypothetical protein
MYNRLYIILIIGLCRIIFQVTLLGQTYTLPGGFIERDLFFTPVSISPNNPGLFAIAAPGFFDHPLKEAFLNPARLGKNLETQQYVYTDYRTLPTVEYTLYRFPSQAETGEYIFSGIGWPVPVSVVNAKVGSPQFTAAWIYRPHSIENVVIGAAYRQLYISDPYYDSYHRYSSFQYGIVRLMDIPVVSFEREQYNKFRQIGYLPTIMASLRINDVLTAGIRTSIVLFSGNGNLRDGRFIQETVERIGLDRIVATEPLDMPPNIGEREENAFIHRGIEQQYFHWETTAGIQWDISEIRSLGLTAGMLYGDVEQLFGVDHFLLDRWGRRYQDNEWQFRRENASVYQTWNRNGFHFHGMLDLLSRHGEVNRHRMQIYYRFGHTSLTLGSRSAGNFVNILDYANYHPATDSQTLSRNVRTLLDGNNLEGTLTGWNHSVGINRQIRYGTGTTLMIGVHLNRESKNQDQANHIEARRDIESETLSTIEYNNDFSRLHQIITRSTNDRIGVTSFILPIILRINVTERIVLEGGVLVQYDDIRINHSSIYTQHYYAYERPSEITEYPVAESGFQREEQEDHGIAAGLLSIGYAVMPGVTIRISGVNEIRTSEKHYGIPVPGSLIMNSRTGNGNGMQFMLGLEAGF